MEPVRGNTELVEIFRGKVLNNSSPNTFNTEIPVSSPVVYAWLRLNHTVVIGTGTGAVSEGELLITKAISFRTDKSEYSLRNVPGRGLYRHNQREFKSAGQKDAVAASNGTYSVLYCIPFINEDMARPYDTIFDPTRYKAVELSITQGSVADLFTSVGTSTVTSTVDLVFEQLKGDLPVKAKPLFYREISGVQPVNPASQSFMDLERAADLALTSVLVATDNSATIGTPFSGTPANTTLSDISLETNLGFPYRTILFDALNRINKYGVAEASAPIGRVEVNLVTDRSYKSALFTGNFSKLRLTWTNGTLSTSQISAITDGIRQLR